MDFKELCNLLVEFTDIDIPSHNIRHTTNLSTDLGLCSCDMMTFIAIIETKTNKQIDIIELSQQMTVGDLLEQINN